MRFRFRIETEPVVQMRFDCPFSLLERARNAIVAHSTDGNSISDMLRLGFEAQLVAFERRYNDGDLFLPRNLRRVPRGAYYINRNRGIIDRKNIKTLLKQRALDREMLRKIALRERKKRR